jgi:hypothetical protein
MLISKRSLITGKVRERDLNITQEQIDEWMNGKISKLAFPNLTDEERNFLTTGTVEEEWEGDVPGEDSNEKETF